MLTDGESHSEYLVLSQYTKKTNEVRINFLCELLRLSNIPDNPQDETIFKGPIKSDDETNRIFITELVNIISPCLNLPQSCIERAAFLLLERFPRELISSQTLYNEFRTALLIIMKSYMDEPVPNKNFAELFNKTLQKVNLMELEFLKKIQYKAIVHDHDLQGWLQKHAALLESLESAAGAVTSGPGTSAQANVLSVPAVPMSLVMLSGSTSPRAPLPPCEEEFKDEVSPQPPPPPRYDEDPESTPIVCGTGLSAYVQSCLANCLLLGVVKAQRIKEEITDIVDNFGRLHVEVPRSPKAKKS